MVMMKILLLLYSTALCIVAIGATINSADIFLSLKGQPIPTNGTGVVIFKDIGGYLGAVDGLICTTNSSDFMSQYWSYPNKTFITKPPSPGMLGTSNCNINNGGSLYYSGAPTERGQFQCIFEISSSHYVNISLNIVDVNITGPNLVSPGEIVIAGEEVELSVNVTTSPADVLVPYQWLVNGTNLRRNNDKYQGIQTDTLTIFNAEDEDQGIYTCSVANSASGITVNSTKLIVVTLRIQVSGSTIYPETAKSYTLNCQLTGDDHLRLSHLDPAYEYYWLKNGQSFGDSGSAIHTFNSLTFNDAGNYQCQVFITFNRRLNRVTVNGTSPQFQLLYQVALYRIYLNIKMDCHEWTSTSNMPNKCTDINSHIIQGIKDKCNDIQVKDDIITNNDHAFGCPTSPDETVVYSAQLHGNDLTNTSVLVSCLDNWIKDTPVIVVDEVDVKVNKKCTSVVDNYNSALNCESSASSGMSLGDGLAIGFGCAFFLAIFFIFGRIVWYRYCRHHGRQRGYQAMGDGGEGQH